MQGDLAMTEARRLVGLPDLPTAPDIKISVRQSFGIDSELQVPAFSQTDRVRARDRRRLSLRPRHHPRDPGRLRLQPPGHDPGLPRHRQVDPHRAGRGPSQLALRAGQSGQPHPPHRPDRQGRDRAARRQAGHRVPRGHAALGAAASGRAGVRRVRRRPARRHVRDPARARGRGPDDAPRPEPGDPAAPVVPAVLDRQHGRARRHQRPLSRHPADQPGPARPLEHRRPAQLPGARRRGRDRARQMPGAIRARTAAQDPRPHGQPGRSVALGLHGRRHLDRDVAPDGHHLGGECAAFSATSASPSG